jgi:hypothetical protein
MSRALVTNTCSRSLIYHKSLVKDLSPTHSYYHAKYGHGPLEDLSITALSFRCG